MSAKEATKEDSNGPSTADSDLLKEAEAAAAEEKYFRAAACLSKVANNALLTEYHKHILDIAQRGATVKEELFQPFEEGGWHKQSEVHGHRDTCIYFKVHSDASLVVRIETPIEFSLLNPLLSVFNESDFYQTWMPSFRFPRLGVQVSEKMLESGRGNQVIRVVIAMPFPFFDRECIQHAVAIDSIEEEQEDSSIVIVIESLDEGKHFNLEIPAPEHHVRRVDFQAGIVIRQCPKDHPALQNSKNTYGDEKLLLVQITQMMDAHVTGVPMSLINFFTRTVIGSMWGSLLQVAEDVRDGKRAALRTRIAENRELYEWVESRVDVLLQEPKSSE